MIQNLLVSAQRKFLWKKFQRRWAGCFGAKGQSNNIHDRKQDFCCDNEREKLQEKLSPKRQIASANFSGCVHVQNTSNDVLLTAFSFCYRSHVKHLYNFPLHA